MANNRMFLVYRPTGDAVFLGKRMGVGWYGTPDDVAERIQMLFEKAKMSWGFSQDDFAIAMESGEKHPHVIDNWRYKELNSGKIINLDIGSSVPFGSPENI